MDIVLNGLRAQKEKREQEERERRLAGTSYEELFREFCGMQGLKEEGRLPVLKVFYEKQVCIG